MPLTSTSLALLVEIGRTGSLARAALRLGVTPPAVSQQLTRMEKEIGIPLVERGARGARLTPLGEQLALHGGEVAAVLARADEAVAWFIGTHSNRLRVGAPPSLGVGLVPDVVAARRVPLPTAELSVVDIMSDAGGELVDAGVLDVALSATYGAQPYRSDRVSVHHLLRDPIVVVMPDDHQLAQGTDGNPVDLADLAAEAWASGPLGRPSRAQLDDAAAHAGFVAQVPFQTESYDVAQALADAGVAVGLIPLLARKELPKTTARPLARALAREIYVALPSSDEHVPLAREFLARLHDVVASRDA
jgi:DNA-binding transcriptional LysR family regulator